MYKKSIKDSIYKIIFGTILLSMILSLSAVNSFARAKPIQVSIGSVKCNPGSEVKMDIKFSDVPEKGITSAQFNVEYDKSKLSLSKDGIKSGNIVHNPMFDIVTNEIDTGITVIYADYDMTGSSFIKSDGTFLELTFKVNEDCPSSFQSIKLTPTYELDLLNKQKENLFYSEIYNPVLVSYLSGKITVGNPKPIAKLVVDKPAINISGSEEKIDAAPKIIGGRTLLPIRPVIEAFGGTIDWKAAEKKLIINLGTTKVEMIIKNKTVTVNGKSKTIDVPPQIIDGRTFVPVRFVSENAGLKVNWESTTKTVTISQ
ncbi:MAG: stalk domain-containing protein [Bacillota bacterium]|nr:stalk domain-containing protein [Bacillota bacterium]